MDVTGLTDKQIRKKMKDCYFFFKKIEDEYNIKMNDPLFKNKLDKIVEENDEAINFLNNIVKENIDKEDKEDNTNDNE